MSYSYETLRRPRKVAFYGRVSTELEAQTAALKSQILKDVAELESAKQEGLVVERAYKALRRSYDTKISQEKALPSRLRVQRQVLGRGDMFTRRGSGEFLGAFVPETFAMPLKSQCILDYIVQLARVKLACGTAVSQVGGKAAGS